MCIIFYDEYMRHTYNEQQAANTMNLDTATERVVHNMTW